MKAILVDDEIIALEVLERLLANYEDVKIMGKYTNPLEALEKIDNTKPDIIFLDIEMGEVTGLEIAEHFTRKLGEVEIVFTTAYSEYAVDAFELNAIAYSEYAVDAFELNAIDYLLKPIQERRLTKTLDRIRGKLEKNQIPDVRSLQIASFGEFGVFDAEGKTIPWRTQKSKELFAYLWVKQDNPIHKLVIMEDVFQDRELDKATTLLHTTIYQLRKTLEKLGYKESILYSNDKYQLNVTIKSDLAELVRIVEQKQYNHKDVKNVLSLYKGDFLEKEGYHWVLELQQIYRNFVFNSFEKYIKEQLDEISL